MVGNKFLKYGSLIKIKNSRDDTVKSVKMIFTVTGYHTFLNPYECPILQKICTINIELFCMHTHNKKLKICDDV